MLVIFLTILTISIIFLTMLLVAVRRRPFLFPKQEERLPPRARFEGLFTKPDEKLLAEIERQEHEKSLMETSQLLLSRARDFDFSVLLETKDKILRESLLDVLLEQAGTNDEIRRLALFAIENHTNVKTNLANRFRQSWKEQPSRNSTIQMFQMAALTNNAQYFQAIVEDAFSLYQAEDSLPDLSAAELNDLIDSHYWLLSDAARTSGAGFLLKQKLASVRRELTKHKTRRN